MNKRTPTLFLAVIMLAGCASLEQDRTEPLLTMVGMDIARQGPNAARLGALRCSVKTRGGHGKVAFVFRILKAGIETIEYSGEEAAWNWSPKEPGAYQVKATATDDLGISVDSGWSSVFSFAPQVDSGSLYAVLPVDNMSGSKAPLKEIQQALITALSAKGFHLLAHEVLEDFMEKNRVRYTGGLSSDVGRKLREEHGVDGVFITSLETWQDGSSPRVSLFTRVDLAGEVPEILWIDSVGLTGNDTPGLLGLGRIKRAEKLLDNGMDSMVRSFQLYLAGGYPTFRFASDRQSMVLVNSRGRTADFFGSTIKGRHRPRFAYRASDFDQTGHYSVVVVPFLNVNAKRSAGYVVALHLVKQLSRYENLRVVEPGLVRQTMLRYRMIMEAGPSLAASDILASENILGADLILSGNVFDYQGEVGVSKVDFSVQAFDGVKREVIWTSRSYANGDEGAYFFDVGRVPSAHGLTTRMSKAVVDMLEE